MSRLSAQFDSFLKLSESSKSLVRRMPKSERSLTSSSVIVVFPNQNYSGRADLMTTLVALKEKCLDREIRVRPKSVIRASVWSQLATVLESIWEELFFLDCPDPKLDDRIAVYIEYPLRDVEMAFLRTVTSVSMEIPEDSEVLFIENIVI